MSDKDGGQAFPHTSRQFWHGGGNVVEKITDGGMSLRDWYAGMALQGLISVCVDLENIKNDEDMAREAYKTADAMIKARNG